MKTRYLLVIFIVYLLLLLKMAVFKDFNYLKNSRHFENYNRGYLDESFERANFIPFKTIYYYVSKQEKYETGALNILGNIAIFIPAGLLLPLLFKRSKQKQLVFSFILLSLILESLQLLINYGNFDIDDILLNTYGGYIGVVIIKWIAKIKR